MKVRVETEVAKRVECELKLEALQRKEQENEERWR